ncbi:hypothetical protein [Tenacibaculum jejuense]|uniref:Uncharacterized protein n=1 Tax=Tenacibaculum jejuense TaxID=584609 RepID=A0A238U7U0_9FLAO|nr:hypothetical protein [Tenacibaculum jejuense]SNR14668.1 protein of unknown function [Tenacibaculum jejuense]
MQKTMSYISKIVDNPYIKLITSIGLIIIGIEQIYKADVLHMKVHWKHGVGFYGILILIEALFKIIKGVVNAYRCKFTKVDE